MSKVLGSVRLTPEAWEIAKEIARRLSEDLGRQYSVAQAIEVALREKARRDLIEAEVQRLRQDLEELRSRTR